MYRVVSCWRSVSVGIRSFVRLRETHDGNDNHDNDRDNDNGNDNHGNENAKRHVHQQI